MLLKENGNPLHAVWVCRSLVLKRTKRWHYVNSNTIAVKPFPQGWSLTEGKRPRIGRCRGIQILLVIATLNQSMLRGSSVGNSTGTGRHFRLMFPSETPCKICFTIWKLQDPLAACENCNRCKKTPTLKALHALLMRPLHCLRMNGAKDTVPMPKKQSTVALLQTEEAAAATVLF